MHSNLLILIQERSTGRSRGFGYVTFASVDDAKVTFTCIHAFCWSYSHLHLYHKLDVSLAAGSIVR